MTIEIVSFPIKNMVIFHSYVNVYQRVVDPNVGKPIMNRPPKSPKSPISRDMFTIPKWFIIVLLTLLFGFQPSKVQGFRYHPQFCEYFWVNYNELTTSSLEIIVSKGNHP